MGGKIQFLHYRILASTLATNAAEEF